MLNVANASRNQLDKTLSLSCCGRWHQQRQIHVDLVNLFKTVLSLFLQLHPDQLSSGLPPPPPLSPISETVVHDDSKAAAASSSNSSFKASNASFAAASDESVAGDSGVYEAAPRPKKVKATARQQQQLEAVAAAAGLSSMSLETAQVKIKLRYSVDDALLHVGIERARNLGALFIPENKKM